MKLTNPQLLLLLAWAGAEGLTVTELGDRLGVSARDAKWRLKRLAKQGLVEGAETRGRGTRGRPSRVFRLTAPFWLPTCAPPCSKNDTGA